MINIKLNITYTSYGLLFHILLLAKNKNSFRNLLTTLLIHNSQVSLYGDVSKIHVPCDFKYKVIRGFMMVIRLLSLYYNKFIFGVSELY